MLLFISHVALLLLHHGIKGAVSGDTSDIPEVIKAKLGEQLSLDCTYNCSSGFIRGTWKWENFPVCATCWWDKFEKNMSEEMCMVSLQTLNLTLEQTLYNYSCFSVQSDHPDLPHKLERLMSLQTTDETAGLVMRPKVSEDVAMKVVIYRNQNDLKLDLNLTVASSHSVQVQVQMGDEVKLECLSTSQLCQGQWMKDDANSTGIIAVPVLHWSKITEEDAGTYTCHTNQCSTSQKISVVMNVREHDEFGWIKPVAGGLLSVAVVLILLLIYLCYRKKGKNGLDAEELSAVIYENTRTRNEKTVHKPIDCQSDHEAPYADIVFSMRGSSIPELAGLHGQTPRDHKLRWRDEAAGASHLQPCRSADRLHVQPREISRKLSTTSEYAVITYSTEALH